MKKITRPILLVEDNPMDVDLTRRAFAKRKLVNPFEVLRDGEEALIYIRNRGVPTHRCPWSSCLT